MYDLLTDLKGNNENAFGKLYIDYFKSVERFIVNNKGTIQKNNIGVEIRGGASMMNGACNSCHLKAPSGKDFVFSK